MKHLDLYKNLATHVRMVLSDFNWETPLVSEEGGGLFGPYGELGDEQTGAEYSGTASGTLLFLEEQRATVDLGLSVGVRAGMIRACTAMLVAQDYLWLGEIAPDGQRSMPAYYMVRALLTHYGFIADPGNEAAAYIEHVGLPKPRKISERDEDYPDPVSGEDYEYDEVVFDAPDEGSLEH